MSAGTLSTSEQTSQIIDWLTSAASTDVHAEARALTEHLDLLHAPKGITHAQFHRCIELFFSRSLTLATEIRRQLRSVEQPLTREWVVTSGHVCEALFRISQGFERVVSDASRGILRTVRRLGETASARALRLLCEQYVISCQTGREPDSALWQAAFRLYQLSRSEAAAGLPAGSPAETTLYSYKRLLSIATLEPLSFSPAELDWAAEYAARICGQMLMQEDAPASLNSGAWHWLSPAHGAEPLACGRVPPPPGIRPLFLATNPLAQRAAELLARHEGGRAGVELEASEVFPGVQPASLLERMRQRWHTPPKREHPRRNQQYTIEACVGLGNIWRALRGKRRTDSDAPPISRWDVVNESPGGYAIMHVEGAGQGLSAGTAIALRREPSEPWSICVVRWLRSEGNGGIEMGLQIVSRGAVPVQVGFRNSSIDRNMSLVDALVLPVLPALRQHQAVLAPSGTYTARRFALVSDIDRLYIAQGRLLSLDMQTANVELFQFEIDPYPL